MGCFFLLHIMESNIQELFNIINSRLYNIKRRHLPREFNRFNYEDEVLLISNSIRKYKPEQACAELRRIILTIDDIIEPLRNVSKAIEDFIIKPGKYKIVGKSEEERKEMILNNLLKELEYYRLEFENLENDLKESFISEIPQNGIKKIKCKIGASEFLMLFRLLESRKIIEYDNNVDLFRMISSSFSWMGDVKGTEGYFNKIYHESKFLDFWKAEIKDWNINLLQDEMNAPKKKTRKKSKK